MYSFFTDYNRTQIYSTYNIDRQPERLLLVPPLSTVLTLYDSVSYNVIVPYELHSFSNSITDVIPSLVDRDIERRHSNKRCQQLNHHRAPTRASS